MSGSEAAAAVACAPCASAWVRESRWSLSACNEGLRSGQSVGSKGGRSMRVVALEEHFAIPALIRQIGADAIARRGFPVGGWKGADAQLADLGPERLRDMDQSGITVQVLSSSRPGADLVDGAYGASIARSTDDVVARA